MSPADPKQTQQIQRYLDAIIRKKELIICCFFFSILAGIGFYLKTSKVYKSTALIMYQQSQINPSKMSPDEGKRIGQMVNTVSEQVTSRSTLEDIITQFGLYPELRQKLPMEDIVILMREKHIEIKNQKGDIFQVSFQGDSPSIVMKITNALAAKFIEENLRFREARASETSAYVKDELAMAKEALDQKESAMRDYKLKYYNEMPQQLQVNMGRLNALQQQYQSNQTNAQNLEQTKIMVLEQISLRKEVLDKIAKQHSVDIANMLALEGPGNSDSMDNVIQLQEALATLRSKYTDDHPDVKRLRQRLKNLTTAKEVSPESPELKSNDSPVLAIEQTDQQLNQLEIQLKEVNLNLDRLKEERQKIQKQIEIYQEWVNAAPIREAEWSALTRDYNELKSHYEELVATNIAAQSAENLEKRLKGSQFRIVDPAHLPEKPFKPDFVKIMLVTIGLGLLLGGGIAVGLEMLDSSFKNIAEMEDYLGLTVSCTVPLINTPLEKNKARMKNIVWAICLSGCFFAISAGILVLWKKGLIII